MRSYRKHEKRIMYSQYAARIDDLNYQLKSGKINQDEFERQAEILDDRFSAVR